MVIEAKGYLSEDQKFFEKREDAEYHDAERKLIAIIKVKDMSEDFVFDFLNTYENQILEYYRCKKNIKPDSVT